MTSFLWTHDYSSAWLEKVIEFALKKQIRGLVSTSKLTNTFFPADDVRSFFTVKHLLKFNLYNKLLADSLIKEIHACEVRRQNL